MGSWKCFSSFSSNIGMTLFVMIHLLLLGSVVGGRTGFIGDVGTLKREHMSPSTLKHLAIKTILSEDGDIIDCVDIYRQPALNHPLLKNHTIQMRPSFYAREVKNDMYSKSQAVKQIWQKSGGCPVDTIPIQRNREEGLFKAFPLSNYGEQVSSDRTNVEETIAYTTHSAPYYGVKSVFNVWNIHVEPKEFSSVVVAVSSIDQSNLAVVGWGVWPDLHGDNRTRLAAYWTADSGVLTGCFNLLCPGFVQVNNKISLGGTISPVSSYGGTQHTFHASITKDDAQSSWWLEVDGLHVGYWPISLYNDLEAGTQLIWGGSVYNSNINGHHTSTQLGSGHFANQGYGKAAFVEGMQAMDSSKVFATPSGIEYAVPKPHCYSISHPGPSNGHGDSFYLGGPGGSRCG